MKTEQSAKRFFLLLLAVTSILLGLTIFPLTSGLFMAAILGGFLWPPSKRLTKALRGRKTLAASIMVFGVVVVLVVPVILLSAFVVKEGSEGLEFISDTVRGDGVQGFMETLPAPLQKVADRVIERLPQQPGATVDESEQKPVSEPGGKAAETVGGAATATGSLLFQAAMMLIALFFLLIDGDKLVVWLSQISPLRKGQTRELLVECKKVSYAVIVSTTITSAVQAAAALVGYFIARVPHPFFFGAITFVFAFIPAIGAGAVCIAAAAFLFLTGHPYMALFLAVWGIVVVGLIDNVVKPFLVKDEVEMHGAVVFFALVGGVAAFGAVGLLLGPLVVALFLALLRMYHRDFTGSASADEARRSEPKPRP